MRHLLTAFLSTAAIAALLSATPVAAQVAGNPGDQHTPTPYTNRLLGPDPTGTRLATTAVRSLRLARSSGSIGAMGAGVAGGPVYATQPHAQCGVASRLQWKVHKRLRSIIFRD